MGGATEEPVEMPPDSIDPEMPSQVQADSSSNSSSAVCNAIEIDSGSGISNAAAGGDGMDVVATVFSTDISANVGESGTESYTYIHTYIQTYSTYIHTQEEGNWTCTSLLMTVMIMHFWSWLSLTMAPSCH